MKYKVLETFKVKTTKEEIDLQPGQVITLPHDTAIKLLNEGRITPVERVAYRVYSEILQAYLWVVETDEDKHALRSQGATKAIYTGYEIEELKKLSKEDLKEIHRVKEVFPESCIEEIKKNHESRK